MGNGGIVPGWRIARETSATRDTVVRLGHALGLGQSRGQDPHELCRRRRPHLGPGVRQVVLHGRVRQAEAVGGCLRSGLSLPGRTRSTRDRIFGKGGGIGQIRRPVDTRALLALGYAPADA